MENSQLSAEIGGLIPKIASLGLEQTELLGKIAEAERKLKELPEVIALEALRAQHLLQLAASQMEEQELRETAKETMMVAGVKDFTLLDGTKIAIQYTPGAIVIEDDSKVPEKYWKTKETKRIDKTALKKDFNAGEPFDQSIYVQKDVKLVISFK